MASYEATLSVVEKVILLQNVDVFSEVSTEQLAVLATIAREARYEAEATIYAESDPSDAMYIVLEGSVRLRRGDVEVGWVGVEEAFGTWALFDDEFRVVGATASEPTRLLCIAKDDFIDLLADNVEITRGVLKAVVGRLRGLLARFGAAGS